MSCTSHKPLLPSEINKLSPTERLERIAEAFEDDAYTTIRIDHLKMLLKSHRAVPDLLKALQTLKEAVEYTPLGERGIKAVEGARVAIAKATEEPT